MHAPLACALALAVASAPTAPDRVAALLGKVDAAWPDRDRPERLAEVTAALEEAARERPDAYEVLWRQARLDVWLADDLPREDDERSRLGKRAWDEAERAIVVEPDRVEGHLYAALGMGNYALSLGVLRAIRQGIEGKFKARLSRAEEIDPAFQGGTIYVAWGRYWQELPWPKYDAAKSEAALRKALQLNPASVRARVYLAELYLKERKRRLAQRTLEDALQGGPGSYDAAEQRRMLARARVLLQSSRSDAGGDDDRAGRIEQGG